MPRKDPRPRKPRISADRLSFNFGANAARKGRGRRGSGRKGGGS
jgi:hypothetical protein